MNHAKVLTGLALASIILSGCASSGSAAANAPASLETYQAALAEAKTSLQNAKKANFLWRDSEKILKKAAKAAKAGDFETAIKLTNKAKRQGELALAQSKAQANAGPRP